MGRASRLTVLAVACALAGGCNSGDDPKPEPGRASEPARTPEPEQPAPDRISREDAQGLLEAREGIGQALGTVRAMRRSPAKARELHSEVREVVSGGALESNELDDFGKAALGDIGLAVPSLVERDADGVPNAVNRDAVAAFLRHAPGDPARALVTPARENVSAIEEAIESANAGATTRVPGEDPAAPSQPVPVFLKDAEAALAPTWPGLGQRLRSLREGLATPPPS